ncbi:hypothetical protein LTR37_003841 [Vermiconidia calcicola]|uniref:Uncharacterized protein n=1 Tax=Vermiconidia calcicola TaxID=1690605 RepID=A0ACC3NNU2_9PEZI|nr:hypothetical protein LTR37_003841 [Vermiconidia calcicola]
MANINKSLTDPNWPIDYPAIVLQDFSPTVILIRQNFVAVRVHDEVKVRSKPTVGGYIYIQYPKAENGDDGAKGYVPRNTLRVGIVRKIGEPLELRINLPYRPHLDQTVNPQNGALFYNTIVGLLSSYHVHRTELPTVPIYIGNILNTQQKITEFAENILNGVYLVNSSLVVILNDMSEFNIFDIRNNSWAADRSMRKGIYLIVYSDYPGAPLRIELYVGSTGQSFRERYASHVAERQKANPKGVHYRSAAKARVHQVFPICLIDAFEEGSHNLKIAEQLFVDLFQSTCSPVLNYQTYVETDEDYVPSPGNTLSNEDVLSRVAKYTVDKDEACVLKDLAEQVFSRTGWPGGVRRGQNQGKPFGATTGLNWSMPLTELQFVKTTWIKTSIPGKVLNFRRSGGIVRDEGNGTKVLLWKYKPDDTQFTFTIPQHSEGPDFGTKIQVVFEIRIDGQPSPAQWARVPFVGSFDDWFDATTMSLRIEWKDRHGMWCWRHVQLETHNNSVVPRGPYGATLSYAIATGMKAFFLQQDRKPTDQDSPWLIDFGIATIKEIYIDHLEQAICTRSVQDRHQGPLPKQKTLQELGNELKALGALTVATPTDTTFPDLPYGTVLADLPQSGNRKNACDHCRSNQVAGKPKYACEKISGSNQCKECRALGRPCTFTPDSVLFDTQRPTLLNASINPKPKEDGVHYVRDRLMFEF